MNTGKEKVNDDVEIENLEKEVVQKNKQENMKKNIMKKKEKRRILATHNKGLKQGEKAKNARVQMDEKKIWAKLNELYANFARMKELKKKTAKRSR